MTSTSSLLWQRDPRGMHTMHAATRGDMSKSSRFREILEPLGLGDELRMAFADKTGVWGFVCMHRELGCAAVQRAGVGVP